MKRAVAVVLTVVLLLQFFVFSSTTVSAEEYDLPESTTLFLKESVESGETKLDDKLALKLQICDAFYQSLSQFNMTVELAPFGLDRDNDSEMILNCISYIEDVKPELFWFWNVNPRFWIYTDKNGKITKIVFDYTPTDTDKQQVAEYFSLIDGIARRVPKNINKIEQLLFIYNLIATEYKYDLTYTNYDAYSFLTQKTGVCDAYSRVFLAVAEKIGIPCTRAIFERLPSDSKELQNHAWNIVKLGNENYHIDVTWADPAPDTYGEVSFEYFMLDSAKIDDEDDTGNHSRYESSENHYLDAFNVSCNDGRYDSDRYFWDEIEGSIAYYNGGFYFIENIGVANGSANAAIYRVDDMLYANKTLVTKITSPVWRPSPTSYFNVFYSSLAIVGTQLYYNTQNSIMCYDLISGSSCEAADLSKYGKLYSISYLNDGSFGFATVEFQKISQTGYAIKVSSDNLYIPDDMGDINQNGSIGATDDMICLRKYLLYGDATGLCLAKGDVSGNDGIVNIKDLLKMKKIAAELL